MALVLDTGVIFAALNADDPAHAACRQLVEGAEETRLVPIQCWSRSTTYCERQPNPGPGSLSVRRSKGARSPSSP